MYVRVRAYIFTCVSARTTHCAPIARMYVYSRTHTQSSRIPLPSPPPPPPPPPPPCLNLNRLFLLLRHRRPCAVAYHSSSTYQTLIQSEYKCCPLKQAGNGGKPSTTSTTELFLRPRLFSSLLVVRRVLNEYVWLLLAVAAAAAAAEELLTEGARRCVRFA